MGHRHRYPVYQEALPGLRMACRGYEAFDTVDRLMGEVAEHRDECEPIEED